MVMASKIPSVSAVQAILGLARCSVSDGPSVEALVASRRLLGLSMWRRLLLAGAFSVAYRALYRIALSVAPKMSTSDKVEWASRVAATPHALLATTFGWNCFRFLLRVSRPVGTPWNDMPSDAVSLAFGGHPLREHYLLHTCGFLMHDLALILQYPALQEAGMLAHHTLLPLGFLYGSMQCAGPAYMSCYLFNEVSSLFLNIRWFLEHAGVSTSSPAYIVNAACLWLTFLLGRVCFNGYLLVHMQSRLSYCQPILRLVLAGADLTLLPLLAFAHNALNWFWFYLMSRKGLRLLGVLPPSTASLKRLVKQRRGEPDKTN